MLTDRQRFNEIYRVGYDHYWSRREIPIEVTGYIDSIFDTGLLNKNSPILDLGCGKGRLLKYLEARGFTKLYGIDISDQAIRFAKSHDQTSRFILTDAKNSLPFPDKTFSLVVELTFLSSLNPSYWSKILKEINRVLKSNGHFLSEIFVRNQNNTQTNNLYDPLIGGALPKRLDQVYGVNETELDMTFGKYFRVQNYMPQQPELNENYFILSRKCK